MIHREQLWAAIANQPDDEVLRLVYADWLEDQGRWEQAEFVRWQVSLAARPRWDPEAVKVRWRRPEWLSGHPFLPDELPDLSGTPAEWAKQPFRRGLPAAIRLPNLVMFEEVEARLLGKVPIEEITLGAGCTLEQLRRLAASPLLQGVRRLILAGNPIEPLLALRDSPNAGNIRAIHFLRSGGAGLPVALEDLFAAPLGRGLQELHFRAGGLFLDNRLLFEALADAPTLLAFSFVNMALLPDQVRLLFRLPALQTVQSLDLSDNPSETGQEILKHYNRLPALKALHLNGVDIGMLNPLSMFWLEDGLVSRPLAYWSLQRCPLIIIENLLGMLLNLWKHPEVPQLTELDIRNSHVLGHYRTPRQFWTMLRKHVPPAFAALVISGHLMQPRRVRQLRNIFGERLIAVKESLPPK